MTTPKDEKGAEPARERETFEAWYSMFAPVPDIPEVVAKHIAWFAWSSRASLATPPGELDPAKAMFVARLEKMRDDGNSWLTIPAVLALLNDCDMLTERAALATLKGTETP